MSNGTRPQPLQPHVAPYVLQRPADSNNTAVPPVVFFSAQQQFIAEGIRDIVTVAGERVAPRAAELAAEHPTGVVFGILPFDARHDARLIVPDLTRDHTPPDHDTELGLTIVANRAEPPAAGYLNGVARALERMRHGELRKVVLSRRLTLEFDRPIDIGSLVARLRRDRHATTFCLPVHGDPGSGPRWLVGASPELLISKQGPTVRSAPLAGSARRVADAALDREAADRLLHSEKDRREHALVVEWIADRLSPYCRQLDVPATPSLTSTDAMWHLGTSVLGELRDSSIASPQLAALLHPTPAVCGVPQQLAAATIAESEPFDRRFYAGVVGWSTANGDGEWVVAIRCAEIAGNIAQLFAGAGIVPGSDPDAELEETSAKFETLLRALGVDDQTAGARA